MAGYSGTQLPKKLGIREGTTVALLNAPNYFTFDFGDLPEDVEVLRDSDAAAADVFIIFANRAAEAERGFQRAVTLLPPDGSIWIAWPKKGSETGNDVVEGALRDLSLPTGMVDDAACDIDETWSGIRFVVPKKDQPGWNQPGK